MGGIFPNQLAWELKKKGTEDAQCYVSPKTYNIGCLHMRVA